MNKLRSLSDAIAANVHDGASVALGCVKDHREFLQLLAEERIEKLRPAGESICTRGELQLLIVI